ncbi:MAG TPA: GNAT family N-acetyltransferase [Elusimicrobiota bacterium]|nr:GNAT family N-acetyltransferase [Elusimicrobiota bacterium]
MTHPDRRPRIAVLTKIRLPEIVPLFFELIRSIRVTTQDPYFRSLRVSRPRARKWLARYIGKRDKKVWVSTVEGRVVGYIAGEIIDCFLPISRVGRIGYISGACVEGPFRRKGIMESLERKMIGFFRKRGVDYAELHILSKNRPARRCWTKLGYRTFREQMRKRIQ